MGKYLVTIHAGAVKWSKEVYACDPASAMDTAYDIYMNLNEGLSVEEITLVTVEPIDE